jgi:hypothetical protein
MLENIVGRLKDQPRLRLSSEVDGDRTELAIGCTPQAVRCDPSSHSSSRRPTHHFDSCSARSGAQIADPWTTCRGSLSTNWFHFGRQPVRVASACPKAIIFQQEKKAGGSQHFWYRIREGLGGAQPSNACSWLCVAVVLRYSLGLVVRSLCFFSPMRDQIDVVHDFRPCLSLVGSARCH